MATTNLLDDPGHVRGDLKMMETAVSRSVANPEIPISDAVIKAMPKIVGNMLLKGDDRVKLRAGELLLKFLQYNASLNPPEQKQPQTTINVGVNVDNRSESSKALELIERFRQGRLSEQADARRVISTRDRDSE